MLIPHTLRRIFCRHRWIMADKPLDYTLGNERRREYWWVCRRCERMHIEKVSIG